MLELCKRLAFVASLMTLLAIDQNAFTQDDQSIVAVESEIRDFFREFESATQEETAERLIKSFDFELFVDAVIQQSGVDIAAPVRNQLLTQMSIMTRREYEALDDRWTRHKVVNVLWTEDKEIAEVFVRHWSEDLTTWRTIYYLKRTDQGLKIYDWMDLALGFSTVSLTAAILRDGAESNYPPQVAQGMQFLFRAMMALMQGEEDGAREWLGRSTGLAVSPVVEALRWHIGAALNLEYEPVYSLECVDKVEAFNDRVIMASFMRASAHMQLGNYEHVVRYAQDYLDQYGADSDTFYTLGVALQQLGRTEEAIEAFKAGLQDTPEAIDLVEELAITLPDDRKPEFAPTFKALPDPIEQFEYLADSFETYEDRVALETLIEVASSMSDELPHLEYYRILPLIFSEQHDEAFKRLVAAIKDPKTDQDYLTFYESRLCTLASTLGKEVEAYDVCTDKQEAIGVLVYHLESPDEPSPGTDEADANRVSKERADKVEKLYQRHAESAPDVPETWVMLAEYEIEKENYSAALVSLAKALKLADDSTNTFDVWENFVLCYVNLDQAIEGYKALEDKPTAFRHFRYLLDEESETFKAIEKLHRDHFPTDLQLVYRDVQSLYESEKYAELLDVADQGLTSNAGDEEPDWTLSEIRFYRILALAHLKRTDDALIASRGEDDETRDHLRALIYAIKGQRQRFSDAYKRCVETTGYFEAEQILEYVKVPEDWFPEVAASENSEFDPYFELRRVVFLLPEPIEIGSFVISQAIDAAELRLFEIQRSELSTSNGDFFCILNDRSAVVGIDQCKYFLSTGNEPYAGNLVGTIDDFDWESVESDVIAEYEALLEAEGTASASSGGPDQAATESKSETDDPDQATLRKAIKSHQAWLAIDIYTWPQNLEMDHPSVIPASASERLGWLARQLVGDRGTVAVHPDSDRVVLCSGEFFEALCGGDPMSAFSVETDEEQ